MFVLEKPVEQMSAREKSEWALKMIQMYPGLWCREYFHGSPSSHSWAGWIDVLGGWDNFDSCGLDNDVKIWMGLNSEQWDYITDANNSLAELEVAHLLLYDVQGIRGHYRKPLAPWKTAYDI